jgi:hypothetical protein
MNNRQDQQKCMAGAIFGMTGKVQLMDQLQILASGNRQDQEKINNCQDQ